MSRMMKMAAVVLVLAAMAFGPSMALAAPHQTPIAAAAGSHFGIIEMLMNLFGITKIGTHSTSNAPVLASPVTSEPALVGSTSHKGGYSTDTATWGGGGH